MSEYTPSKESKSPPIAASASQIQALTPFLPPGAMVLGAVVSSRQSSATDFHAGDPSPCFILVYALEDHTIHSTHMCQHGTDVEIVSDAVSGHW